MSDNELKERFGKLVENPVIAAEEWSGGLDEAERELSEKVDEVGLELESRGYAIAYDDDTQTYKITERAPLLDGAARIEVVAKAVSAYIRKEAEPVEDGNDLAPILSGYLDSVCFHLFEEVPLASIATLIVMRHREMLKNTVDDGEREALVAEIIKNGGVASHTGGLEAN